MTKQDEVVAILGRETMTVGDIARVLRMDEFSAERLLRGLMSKGVLFRQCGEYGRVTPGSTPTPPDAA